MIEVDVRAPVLLILAIPVIIPSLGCLTAMLTALAFAVSIDNAAPLAAIFFVAVQEAIGSTVRPCWSARIRSLRVTGRSVPSMPRPIRVEHGCRRAVDPRFAGVQLRSCCRSDGRGHARTHSGLRGLRQ
jgi:hypothetical protein